MTAEFTLDYSWTELAVREQNGISVRLLWTRGTTLLAVEVVDERNGDSFELVLEPDEAPLDVFYHPYAYAAARGLELGTSAREQEETVDV
jgi:hypothetical protein